MGTTYTRQESGNITDGSVIEASHLNNEYNQIQSAFAASTGHSHDGTAGEGGYVPVVADADAKNKILVDTSSNRFGVFVEVSSSAVEQFRFQDGAIIPVTDNDIDLGTSSLEFKDAYFDGVIYTDSLALPSTTITDILDEDNLASNSNAALATQQSIKAYVDNQLTASDLDFQADSGGALSIDLDSESLTFTGGTGIDTTGSGNAVTFAIDSTITTLSGSQTLTNKTLTSPKINEDVAVTSTATELNLLDGITAGTVSASLAVIADSNKDITGFRNLTTTGVVTVGGDLTVNGTTTTVNSTTVTVDDPIFTLGGDSAPGSDDNKDRGIEFRYHNGSAAKLGFFGFDDSSGKFTFIPDATNSSEVFSGTAGTVVATTFEGNLTGNVTGNTSGTAATVTTAAQSNITSLGTLTTLTVDNIITNGTTIGHTDDTDLLTLASGVLTVAGELDAVSLDISGDADIDGTLEADAITIGGITLAETIADTVGAMVTSNTESGITVTYDDADNTLDFTVGTINQDTTGNAATATILETARTIGGTSFDGSANIAVGLAATATALATARTIHGVSFDGTANIDLSEPIADTIGAMVTSNTETGIAVTYDDADNTLDFVIGAGTIVNSMLADDAVGADELAADAVVNASVASGAAIVDTKLATIATANKVSLTAVDIDGGTDIGADLTTSDLIVVDDGAGGTNRKAALSRVVTLMAANLEDPTALAIALG
jgi:hypothetical protein